MEPAVVNPFAAHPGARRVGEIGHASSQCDFRAQRVFGDQQLTLGILDPVAVGNKVEPVGKGDRDGGVGPYVQSERRDLYRPYAEKLIECGAAYYCFCTKERLEKLHEEDATGGYDRHCRNLSKEEVEANLAAGIPFVIRQKMPLEGVTSYTDSVFGEISMNNSELQDQILMKADGYPTYNFCHVVDDHLMGVTHVVRGSEYLTSTPKYVLLYDAYGWERPKYVHLPLKSLNVLLMNSYSYSGMHVLYLLVLTYNQCHRSHIAFCNSELLLLI